MSNETKLAAEQNPTAGSPPSRPETYRYYHPPGTANPIVVASDQPSLPSWSSASALRGALAFPQHWRKFEATANLQDFHPNDPLLSRPPADAKNFATMAQGRVGG